MGRWTAVLAPLMATIGLWPATAGAAAASPKAHRVDTTLLIGILAHQGNHYTDAGTATGLNGPGAVVEHDVVNGSSFTGTGTTYYANGSIRTTVEAQQVTDATGTVVGDVGTGRFVGGTGVYRGATGSFKGTVTTIPGTTTATVHVTGTIRY